MEETQSEPSPVESARRRLLRRLAASRLWRAQVRYGVVLLAFAVLAFFARANAYFAWDVVTARAVQSLPIPGISDFMRAVSLFGDKANSWILVGLTMLFFLLLRRRTEMFALMLSTGGGALVNRFFKMYIARPRPAANLVQVQRVWAHESFPSGHVTFYVCYFGFLFFVAYALLPKRTLARRVALTLTSLMIALVGLSRVYLGAHWPSDTIGAYFLGGLWLGFSLYMYGRWKERSTFHQDEANAAAVSPARADE
ncbi:MAG TPA: phosphatase PAP2 family protein [Pyrinomonadaceae bacterium]